MKVGLCIVYKNWNYGSILQSFATLMELKRLNVDYEIIRYERSKNVFFYFSSIPRLFNSDMIYSKLRSLRHTFGKIRNSEFAANDEIRRNVFIKFVNQHFDHFTNVIESYDELKEFAKKYDAVIVGSDQLWLPSGLASNFFNLMFVPDKVNKISYAASFGVSKIPTYQKTRTKRFLNRIQHISVREQSGKKIVFEMINREVPVILDPTMIISKSIWDEYIPDKKIIDDDYIFSYFLGDNPKQRIEVKKLADYYKLKIVVLRHLDEYIPSDEFFGDYALYDVGPSEFVNLIRHAKYICTDSFHGSVFSILNHKKFITFNRYEEGKNSRNSRLDTLFSQLGIDRRFKKSIIDEMKLDIDYIHVESKLKKLRKDSENFLTNALGIEKQNESSYRL